MNWKEFALAFAGLELGINIAFALLYLASPGCISNARPGSFFDAYFFSIETLATVGYGTMAPATLYGHAVSAIEIADLDGARLTISTEPAPMVALFLSRHAPDDQTSRLRLPLWTSTSKAEPIAMMLRHTKAGDIGASCPAYTDLIFDRTSGRNTKVHALADARGRLLATLLADALC
jgi:ion channel